MDWRFFALCADLDPELFFPVGTEGPALVQIAEAKAVCADCPVRRQCFDWAMEHDVTGVWGGSTEDERRAIRLLLAA